VLLICLKNFKETFYCEGRIGDELKFHLVNWTRICTLMKSGGLRVRNMIQFNQALLEKWLCSYVTKREALRRMVIKTKYDSLRGG
jgi:hypothetical protein